MKLTWLVSIAAAIGGALANEPPATSPTDNQWQNWVTETEYVTKTDYKVSVSLSISYVTVQVSVPGPTTTIKQTITQTQTNYVSQPPNTVINTVTVTVVQSAAAATVTVTVPQVVPTTVAVTAIVTATAVRTVTQSALSGLVTCESRIINPTYTTSTPLPSNYLWGCPPGKLCYPPRENCNFEQNLPADTYYCKPEDCRPVAQLPPLDTYLNANKYNNGSCAFLTPVDDYFNFRPLDFGLNYGIFNIYGQRTCSASVVCPGPSTVTVKNAVTIAQTVTVPVPTTLINTQTIKVPSPVTIINTETVKVPSPVTIVEEKSSSTTWAAWQGSSAPPHVTKRASLQDLVERQGAPLPAYADCYPPCDYAGYVYQSIGPNFDPLCNEGGDYRRAYGVLTDCILSCIVGGTCTEGTTDLATLDRPRSLCNQGLVGKRALFGRKVGR